MRALGGDASEGARKHRLCLKACDSRFCANPAVILRACAAMEGPMAPNPASSSAHQPPVLALPVCGGRRCRFAVLGADVAVHGSFGGLGRGSEGGDLPSGQPGRGVVFEPIGGGALHGRAPHGPHGGDRARGTTTAWPGTCGACGPHRPQPRFRVTGPRALPVPRDRGVLAGGVAVPDGLVVHRDQARPLACKYLGELRTWGRCSPRSPPPRRPVRPTARAPRVRPPGGCQGAHPARRVAALSPVPARALAAAHAARAMRRVARGLEQPNRLLSVSASC